MNRLREAAQQALEALEGNERIYTEPAGFNGKWGKALDAAIAQQQVKVDAARTANRASIDALRAALAEPVPTVAENATTQQQLEEAPPSEYRRGYWDGFAIGKREGRIEAEDALAEPVQEPVAWSHNLIDNIITHRPADIDRHPHRWTALYPEPKPCPTCEALARTVMLDQTSHDTAPPQRKPFDEHFEVNFCARCGKRTRDVHSCTPPPKL